MNWPRIFKCALVGALFGLWQHDRWAGLFAAVLIMALSELREGRL